VSSARRYASLLFMRPRRPRSALFPYTTLFRSDGVVVGAGSVVRQNVPPYAIVAGNPARVAGFRFPPEQIEALLRIKWWDWSVEQITEAIDLLMADDIQTFIDTYDVRA